MKSEIKICCTIAPIILFGMSAHANNGNFGETYEFTQIVNPTSCLISAPQADQVVSVIPVTQLMSEGEKPLTEFLGNKVPPARVFRVDCNAALSIIFKVTDNRPNEHQTFSLPSGTFGIGEGVSALDSSKTTPIGYYRLKLVRVQDGSSNPIAGNLQSRPTSSVAWVDVNDGYLVPGSDQYSFTGTNTVPQQYMRLSFLPEIVLYGTNKLDINSVHYFDGSYKITMVF